MASLKKRGKTFALVFTRRVEGKLEQRVFSLGVSRLDQAERLRTRYEDQYRLGEIDPFSGWSPRQVRVAPTKPPGNVGLGDLGKQFLESRSHVRERTRREYREQLDRLESQLGYTMPVRLITESDIRAYCFKPRYATATQTTYLRFTKMLFRWLQESGHVEKDVTAGVRYPKKEHRVSEKTITEPQLRSVFHEHRKAQNERRKAGVRRGLHPWFRPMLATYFYGGLRAREGAELRWEKVDLQRGYIHVTGTKSGRERAVPIQKKLALSLSAWHRYCGRPTRGLVFPQRRSPGKELALDPSHVSKTFKEYARAAKLPQSVNLHGLRHSCATELLRRGMGINQVATILGHSSLEVTRIYEHLNERDLRATFERLGL